MKQMFIAKAGVAYASKVGGGTIAGVAEITSLVEGAIAVFTENGILVAGSETEFASKSIFFGTMRDGVPVFSRRFYRPLDYTKLAYVAPAAKVVVVGSNTNGGITYNLNLPSSPVVGTSGSVMIIDRARPFNDKRREKIYEHTATTGETAATFAAAIIAKINADPKGFVTAAEVDVTNHDGFKITADTAGHDFAVACGGILANADVLEYQNIVVAGTGGIVQGYNSGLTTVVVQHKTGRGTSAQILATETEYASMDGDGPLAKTNQNLYSWASAVEAVNYTTYVMRSSVPNDNVLIPKANMTLEFQLAIPTTLYDAGETGTLLDVILPAFVGVTHSPA